MSQRTAIQISHPHSKAPKTIMLSKRIKRVIDMVVGEAKNVDEALTIVGLTRSAYLKASYKPEFLAYQGEALRVIRSHAAAKTISRIDRLADEAESEHVQFEAAKYLGALDGLAPVQRSESISHFVHHTPGLVIVRHDPDRKRLIADQVRDGENAQVINGFAQSVPDDGDRNAGPGDEMSGETEREP